MDRTEWNLLLTDRIEHFQVLLFRSTATFTALIKERPWKPELEGQHYFFLEHAERI